MDVYGAKKEFVQAQIRILGGYVSVDEGTRAQCDELGQSEVLIAVEKVNMLSRKHQRMTFSAQGVAHVAEQIAQLYRRPHLGGQEALELTEAGVLELPEEWPGARAGEQELEEYATLLAQLRGAALAKAALEQKHAYYWSLLQRMRPLDTDAVQPNLLTRDGEMARQVSKTQLLSAKLAARIAALPAVQTTVPAPRQQEQVSAEPLVHLMNSV